MIIPCGQVIHKRTFVRWITSSCQRRTRPARGRFDRRLYEQVFAFGLGAVRNVQIAPVLRGQSASLKVRTSVRIFPDWPLDAVLSVRGSWQRCLPIFRSRGQQGRNKADFWPSWDTAPRSRISPPSTASVGKMGLDGTRRIKYPRAAFLFLSQKGSDLWYGASLPTRRAPPRDAQPKEC